ncbi:uncharacterized protein [Pseudorasbora parva]|uniref:uncharacterized protein n=1 Tax=Pseudorasbora parva TaxID=51549 RepID=UPI00351E9839
MTARVLCSLSAVLLCLSVYLSTIDAGVVAKPGECPSTKSGAGTCAELCVSDHDCPNNEKCCSNGCGRQCMAPYTVNPEPPMPTAKLPEEEPPKPTAEEEPPKPTAEVPEVEPPKPTAEVPEEETAKPTAEVLEVDPPKPTAEVEPPKPTAKLPELKLSNPEGKLLTPVAEPPKPAPSKTVKA